ncbi:LOG family protein [Flavihumibacter solisilvae]|uniref:LOG family protein n=1 Tax=Flavihumibacter solisilvae TaxID=1349421 RepID=UPI0019670A14|nr:LOG family protein [Flavihumibacter solisilvae]
MKRISCLFVARCTCISGWHAAWVAQKANSNFKYHGFYDDLLSLLQKMVDKGFLKAVNRDMLLVSDNIDELLNMMRHYQAPTVGKWISRYIV